MRETSRYVSNNRRSSRILMGLVCVPCFLLLLACGTSIEKPMTRDDVPACHIIYDAGSKGTRLYIYEQTTAGWLKHQGPRTGALADPVRAIRGKTMSDAGTVVNDIVQTLEDIRHDGPVNKKGVPKWPAFDWQKHCNIEAVTVFATAGMRLAEQLDAPASEVLWKMLNDRLSTTTGMEATTRTLSGYEEGLFAWLAGREGMTGDNFGIAEMGGASIQVAFPCAECKAAREVIVQGRSVAVYSHSFQGWGQDEAWKKFGSSPACATGVGKTNPDWEMADCTASMQVFSEVAVDVGKAIKKSDGLRWYLSDAFKYMQDTDVEQFCREGVDSGYEPISACFRAVYLQNVLTTLGLPAESELTDVDWTLGAVICTATRCLAVE